MFKRPRFLQQRVFWSLHEVYKFLALTCFDGQPSKWAGTLGRRWEAMLAKLVGGQHIIQGTYMSEFATKKLDVSWPWLSTVRNMWQGLWCYLELLLSSCLMSGTFAFCHLFV